MDNQIKAALRGDKQAQGDCTAAGVLLPCPFCGGQAQFVRKDIKTNRRTWCDAVYVRCKVCDSRVGRVLCNDDDSAQDEKAVSAWNARASTEVHGRWGEYEAFPITPSLNGNPCSNCKTHFSPSEIVIMNYCTRCGAKMDGGLKDGKVN